MLASLASVLARNKHFPTKVDNQSGAILAALVVDSGFSNETAWVETAGWTRRIAVANVTCVISSWQRPSVSNHSCHLMETHELVVATPGDLDVATPFRRRKVADPVIPAVRIRTVAALVLLDNGTRNLQVVTDIGLGLDFRQS